MAVREDHLDTYVRALRIALRGKSAEANAGAAIVIANLLRFVQGMTEEEQAYRSLRMLLERLADEFHSTRPLQGS